MKKKKRRKKGNKKELHLFSVKLRVKIFYDETEVREIRFSYFLRAPSATLAFHRVVRKVKRKLAWDGYRSECGYRLQYQLAAPLKPLI